MHSGHYALYLSSSKWILNPVSSITFCPFLSSALSNITAQDDLWALQTIFAHPWQNLFCINVPCREFGNVAFKKLEEVASQGAQASTEAAQLPRMYVWVQLLYWIFTVLNYCGITQKGNITMIIWPLHFDSLTKTYPLHWKTQWYYCGYCWVLKYIIIFLYRRLESLFEIHKTPLFNNLDH